MKYYVQCCLYYFGPGTLLDALIPLTAATDRPVPVVDEENRLLGEVDRSAVMHALEGRGA